MKTQLKMALIVNKLQTGGGMETYLFDYINYFATIYDLTVYASKIDSRVKLPKTVLTKKISSIRFLPLVKVLSVEFSLKRMNFSQFDIIVAFSKTSVSQVLVTGGLHKAYVNKKSAISLSLTDKLILKIEDEQVRKAKLVVTHSNILSDDFKLSYSDYLNKETCITVGTNEKKFSFIELGLKSQLREKFKLPQESFIFLFASTGHIRKGIKFIHEAVSMFEENKNIIVAVAGTPLDDQHKHSKILELGFIENMHELYGACDATLLPSIYEPFGLTITESLSVGRPVIASANCGVSQFVTESLGVVLESLDSQSLFQAMNNMVVNTPIISEGFLKINQLRVEDHFTKLNEKFRETI